MAKQIIRPMEERDVERVHQLEVAGFATPWSVQSFRDELRNVCARYVVLEDESGIQAYGGIWMIIGEAQVTTLTTDPNLRGRGYGEAVLRALMQTAYDTLGIQEMTLEVRVGNEPAKHLYHKLGFVTRAYGLATTRTTARTPSSCGTMTSVLFWTRRRWRIEIPARVFYFCPRMCRIKNTNL